MTSDISSAEVSKCFCIAFAQDSLGDLVLLS